jgi:hypothetical protein
MIVTSGNDDCFCITAAPENRGAALKFIRLPR